MHVELRWFLVTLIYAKITWHQYSVHTQLEELENTFAMVINDLIYSALKVFERVSMIKELMFFYDTNMSYIYLIFS